MSAYGDEQTILINGSGELGFLRLAGCYLFATLPVRGMIEAIGTLKEIRDFWAEQPAPQALAPKITPVKTLTLPPAQRGDLILPN